MCVPKQAWRVPKKSSDDKKLLGNERISTSRYCLKKSYQKIPNIREDITLLNLVGFFLKTPGLAALRPPSLTHTPGGWVCASHTTL